MAKLLAGNLLNKGPRARLRPFARDAAAAPEGKPEPLLQLYWALGATVSHQMTKMPPSPTLSGLACVRSALVACVHVETTAFRVARCTLAAAVESAALESHFEGRLGGALLPSVRNRGNLNSPTAA